MKYVLIAVFWVVTSKALLAATILESRARAQTQLVSELRKISGLNPEATVAFLNTADRRGVRELKDTLNKIKGFTLIRGLALVGGKLSPDQIEESIFDISVEKAGLAGALAEHIEFREAFFNTLVEAPEDIDVEARFLQLQIQAVEKECDALIRLMELYLECARNRADSTETRKRVGAQLKTVREQVMEVSKLFAK